MIRVLVLLLAVGCAKREAAPEDGAPPPMTPAEQSQGRSLCDAYAERVCACAAKNPAMQGECDLARSRPEALALHLNLLEGKQGQLNKNERQLTEHAARKTVAGCVAADAKLAPDVCPR